MAGSIDSAAARELVETAVRQLRAATRLLTAEELAHRRTQVESAIAILVSKPAPPRLDTTPSERTIKSWDTRRVLYGREGQPRRDPRR
jgi:hypothetical protein